MLIPLFGDFGLVSQLGSTDYATCFTFFSVSESAKLWMEVKETVLSSRPLPIQSTFNF